MPSEHDAPATSPDVAAWRSRGSWLTTEAGRAFVVDIAADEPALDPVVVLHGFPSSSFDWRHVLGPLTAQGRRVVLFDFIGFGLSDKPDRRYGIELHADTTEAVLDTLGISRCILVTHDMGDSVGGEVLARRLPADRVEANTVAAAQPPRLLEVTRRIVSNGSIYLGLANLTDGQNLLMSLDDAMIGPELAGDMDAASLGRGLAQVFSPGHPASDGELEAQAELSMLHDGHLLLPRLIRYLDDRRRAEGRYTGAIETHPSPLHVIWGTVDPVARIEMVDRLLERRPDAVVTRLDGVGHYPMIEDPGRFGDALSGALAAP